MCFKVCNKEEYEKLKIDNENLWYYLSLLTEEVYRSYKDGSLTIDKNKNLIHIADNIFENVNIDFNKIALNKLMKRNYDTKYNIWRG